MPIAVLFVVAIASIFTYDAAQTIMSGRGTSSMIAWWSHLAVKLTCQFAGNIAQGELAASREQLDSKARETATLNSKVELLQEEVESMTRQVCHHCLWTQCISHARCLLPVTPFDHVTLQITHLWLHADLSRGC